MNNRTIVKGKNMTNKFKFIISIVFIGILSAALAGCGALPTGANAADATEVPIVGSPNSFHAEGKVVPAQFSTLAFFPNGGKVGEILVDEGQSVQAGDALIALTDTESLQAAVESARQAEVNAQKALDNLNDTADLEREQAYKTWQDAKKELLDAQVILNDLDDKEYQDDLGDLEDDVDDEREDLEDEQDNLDKYANLDPSSNKRKNAQEDYDDQEQEYLDAVYERDLKISELETARANVDALTAKVADAERLYNQKETGPDSVELAKTEAALAAARAQLLSAERALTDATLTAPFDGIVVDLFDLTPGTILAAGQQAAQMADLNSLYVETKDLTELDVVKVQVGDAVVINADALPGETLTGTVESVKQVYGEYSGDIVYTVRILLDNPPDTLRWGMTVDVQFEQAED